MAKKANSFPDRDLEQILESVRRFYGDTVWQNFKTELAKQADDEKDFDKAMLAATRQVKEKSSQTSAFLGTLRPNS